jgi:coniferyl-aldehyde dehydrogenase
MTATATADELRQLLETQRDAYREEGFPSLAGRLDRVDRFAAAILEAADDLAKALNEDFGRRPRALNLAVEIVGIVGEVAQIREKLGHWIKNTPVDGSEASGTPTFVQHRPKGVVGVIGPWNFPVALVALPALEALAAGNRVMIKFSDIPTRTADVFADAVASRMPPDEVVVVRGDVSTASAFSQLPFDHIFFTGSPGVGAIVAEAAGRNLVPVTLELGGKNPVVLASDGDVTQAATRTAEFRLLNGGQVCLCPDYVFVPRDKVDTFVDSFGEAVRVHFPQYAENPSAVSIINQRNFERVKGLIDDAVAKGATKIPLVNGPDEAPQSTDKVRIIPPTALLDVTPEMSIAAEEIFGPVVVIYPYDDLGEAIDYVSARPSPLAAYWFGSDGPEFQQFLDRTNSGGVSRNDIGAHWAVDGAPSGGVGHSGIGAYSGKTGFDTFSHHRTVTASTLGEGTAAALLPPVADAIVGHLETTIQQGLDSILARVGPASSSASNTEKASSV